jgi:hypothetical protein
MKFFFGTHRLMHNYIGKNTTLLGYHLGNDNTIVSDEWYDTRNTKTYMINLKFKSSSKVIFDRNSQDVYSDPGILKLEKPIQTAMFCDRNNNAYLIGQRFTKNGQFPFISEFNLKQHKQNVCTLRHTLIKKEVYRN